MAPNRVFFGQEALDLWLAEGQVVLDGEILSLSAEGPRFRLSSAVRLTAEVAGGGDESGLVGKVKSLEDIAVLSGEHVSGSVVLGDNAYEVVDGFLGELLDAARGGEALSLLARLGDGG